MASCGQTQHPSASPTIPRPIAFTPYETPDSANWVELANGLRMYVVSEGPGPQPGPGTAITVHYWGKVKDGKEFGNTFAEGVPLRFRLGNAVPGFNDGISRLKMGSKAVLVIPPALAYGDEGLPPNIPPGSTLEYHVQFLGTY
jgi:FKBP-type peptidyl-prolyl cis-trans isomerase FkpA